MHINICKAPPSKERLVWRKKLEAAQNVVLFLIAIAIVTFVVAFACSLDGARGLFLLVPAAMPVVLVVLYLFRDPRRLAPVQGQYNLDRLAVLCEKSFEARTYTNAVLVQGRPFINAELMAFQAWADRPVERLISVPAPMYDAVRGDATA